MRSAILLLALGAAACSRGGGENLGLGDKRAPAPAIDSARLTQIGVLLEALKLPAGEIDRALGARGVEASSSIKIEPPGKAAEQLDETWRLDSDGRGAWHLVHDNARGYGVEATSLAGALYIRPRYGQFIKRRPEPEELDELRASVEGVAAEYLSLLARQAQAREAGALEVAGHKAIKLALSAAPQPAGGARESDPARRWRDTVRARYLDGELALDAASGALVQARVAASWLFEREGVKGPFAVTLEYKLATVAAQPIVEPAGAAPSPERPRPMVERQALLDGLKERPRARRTHD
ncbi:MAG TPA: hypothetical protein VFF06_22630 [Polyangia bacterium]|nr:hypothetical protein [Polyangia bacterium]